MLLLLDAVGLPDHRRVAVALWRDGAVIEQRAQDVARGAAERIFPLIDTLLTEPRRAGISAIATITGPGGFAACRAGVAAARGLALGLGAPALGVSWLEALAHGRAGRVRVALPTGGGLLAVQRFDDGVAADAPAHGAAAPGDLGADALCGDGLEAFGACAMAKMTRDALARPAPLYLRPPDAVAAPPPPRLIG